MEKVSNNPLISVIVPIYNVEKYLNKCIDSILNQTYKNLEIILVDDGSPDNCGIICDNYKKMDDRIIVIHKKNGGLSDARNTGIDISKGEYLTFIDSDDYVENDYIEILLDLLLKYNADMSIGAHLIEYTNGSIINKFRNEEYYDVSENILYRMLYDNGIDLTACAKLYKRDLFKNIRFPINRLYEDAATTYKFIDKSRVIAVKTNIIYHYVIKNNSITNKAFNENKLDLIASTKEMTDYIKNKYPNLSLACERRLMYSYLSTYNQLIKSTTNNLEIEKFLLNYIKKHRRIVIKDKNTPFRDKIGIICVSIGRYFYKFAWMIYSTISGRKYE